MSNRAELIIRGGGNRSVDSLQGIEPDRSIGNVHRDFILIPANETFEGTWPFEARFFDGNGFRQHYVDEGQATDEGDDVFVCIHGEPTWGYLYRHFISRLSKRGRVVVPDHMGFGKSETPQDREYTMREHCDNLERLLLHLNVRNVTLVLQDWGGPIGSSFAMRHPDRIKCLCVCNANIPWASTPVGELPKYKWIDWVASDQFEPTVSHLSSTILSVMKRIGLDRTEHIDENWVRAYASAFPTVESCKGALQFPRDIKNPKTFEFIRELFDTFDIAALKAIPAMCVVGEQERTTPPELRVFGFKSLWPNGPVVTLPRVSHFLQEDAPETVIALIEQFVQMNNPPRAFDEPSLAWDQSERWKSIPRHS